MTEASQSDEPTSWVLRRDPRIREALEELYGPLAGREDAFEAAAREYHLRGYYGPHLHLLEMHDIVFGINPLPSGNGWWMPRERAIVIDHDLPPLHRRSVLAHLLVHAEQGDPTCRATWQGEPRIAWRCSGTAQAIAAARLIPLLGLARSLKRGLSLREIARSYRVVEEVVHTRIDTLDARERQLLSLLLAGDELNDGTAQTGKRPGAPQIYTRTLAEQAQRRRSGAA